MSKELLYYYYTVKKKKWLNNKEIKCVGCPMVHFTISTDNINHTDKCPLWN